MSVYIFVSIYRFISIIIVWKYVFVWGCIVNLNNFFNFIKFCVMFYNIKCIYKNGIINFMLNN